MSDTRSVRSLAAGCFIAYTALGLTVNALGTALPYLARQTGSSLQLISFLFMGNSLGYTAGTFFGGLLYDRFPGNRLMAGAILAFLPPLVLIPLLRSFAPLLAVYTALGLFAGSSDTGGNILMLWTPAEGRRVRLNALHLFFGVGAFLSPLVLGQAVRLTGGVRWGYWGLALLCLPPALWFARLTVPPRPKAPRRGEEGSRDGRSSRDRRASPAVALPVLLIAGFIFMSVALEAGYGNWIYTYALTRGIADPVTASYLASFFWGSFTGGRLLFTLLSVRLRPRLLLPISLLGVLSGAGLLVLFPGPRAMVWVCTGWIGLFAGPLIANTLTLAGEILEITGRVTGVVMVFMSLGGLSLPWLIGQLFERLGPVVMPAAVLLTAAAALPLYAGLDRLAAAHGRT